MPKRLDDDELKSLEGSYFNSFKVIEYLGRKEFSGSLRPYFLVECVCGVRLERNINTLSRNNSKSCGCKLARKLVKVSGVGVNDADYPINKKEVFIDKLGKKKQKVVWECPFYVRWSHMLRRCYDTKYSFKWPTYKDCAVCEEWLTFSNFKAWMEKQDWEGKELDKDILISNNKIYSPDACLFVDSKVNCFLTDHAAARGEYKQGVLFVEKIGKYRARISNRNGQMRHLGYYITEDEAHLAWFDAKLSYAQELIEEFKLEDNVASCFIERVKEMKEI